MTDPLLQRDDFRGLLNTFDATDRETFLREWHRTPKITYDPLGPLRLAPFVGTLAEDPGEQPERSGFLETATAAAALENVTGRLAFLAFKHGGYADVGTVHFRGEDGRLTTELDVDRWFSENRDYLASLGAGGEKIIQRYSEGAYDHVTDGGHFIGLLGFDITEGELREDLNNSSGIGGFLGTLVGASADPIAIYGGGYVLRTGGGALFRLKQAGKFSKAWQQAREAQLLVRASGTTTSKIGAAAIEGASMSAVQQAGFAAFGDEERTFTQHLGQFALDTAADAAWSGLFIAAGSKFFRTPKGETREQFLSRRAEQIRQQSEGHTDAITSELEPDLELEALAQRAARDAAEPQVASVEARGTPDPARLSEAERMGTLLLNELDLLVDQATDALPGFAQRMREKIAGLRGDKLDAQFGRVAKSDDLFEFADEIERFVIDERGGIRTVDEIAEELGVRFNRDSEVEGTLFDGIEEVSSLDGLLRAAEARGSSEIVQEIESFKLIQSLLDSVEDARRGQELIRAAQRQRELSTRQTEAGPPIRDDLDGRESLRLIEQVEDAYFRAEEAGDVSPEILRVLREEIDGLRNPTNTDTGEIGSPRFGLQRTADEITKAMQRVVDEGPEGDAAGQSLLREIGEATRGAQRAQRDRIASQNFPDESEMVRPPDQGDRQIFNTREEAIAAGALARQEIDAPLQGVDGLSEGDIRQAQALLSAQEVAQLNRVVEALDRQEAVPIEDFNDHVAAALNRIADRSPNLRWNPASLGAPGTVPILKLEQPILHAETVGFVPMTNLESLVMALKRLGLAGRDAIYPPASSPPPGYRGPAAPRTLPPSPGSSGDWRVPLADRYARNSVTDPIDLFPDFSKDSVRKLTKEVRRRLRLRERHNASGPITGQSSAITGATRYQFSENPIVVGAFSSLSENLLPSRARVTGSWQGRPPAERTRQTYAIQSRQTQRMIDRQFKAFFSKLPASSVSTRASRAFRRLTGTLGDSGFIVELMDPELRNAYQHYLHMLEELRIATRSGRETADATLNRLAEANQAGLEGDALGAAIDGPSPLAEIEAAVNDALARFYPGVRGAERLKLAEELVGELRKLSNARVFDSELSALLRRADDPEPLTPNVASAERRVLDKLTRSSTSIVLKADTPLDALVEVLRVAQDLPVGSDDLTVLGVFSRMTDGTAQVISEADILAARTDALKARALATRVVRSFNERLLGLVPTDRARAMLASEVVAGGSRYPMRRFLDMDIKGTVAAHHHVAARFSGAESLLDYLLVLQRVEETYTPGTDLFDDLFDRWNQVEAMLDQDLTLDAGRSFVDNLDRWTSDAVDSITSYAARHVDRIPDVSESRAKKLRDQTEAFNEFAKERLGLRNLNPEEREIGRTVGRHLLAGTQNLMLGRMGLAVLHDSARVLRRAWTGPVWKNLSGTLDPFKGSIVQARKNNVDLGYVANQMSTFLESELGHVARRLDSTPVEIGAEELVRGGGPDLSARLSDGALALNEQVLRKTIADASLMSLVNRRTRALAFHISRTTLLDPQEGLIPKVRRVVDLIESGVPEGEALLREGLIREGVGGAVAGRYSDYTFIRDFLSDADLRVLDDAIGANQTQTVPVPRRLFSLGELKSELGTASDFEIIGPVKGSSLEEVAAFDRLAMLMDSWIEKRAMNIPGDVDSLQIRDPHSFIQRAATMFLKPAIAQANRTFVQTGNAPLAQRLFDVLFFSGIAFGVRYLREAIKGTDERFEDDLSDPVKRFSILYETTAYTGVLGWGGDRFGGIIAELFSGDSYNTRRSAEFAIGTPVQSMALGTAVPFATAIKKIVTGEDLTPSEQRAIRKVASANLLETTMAGVLRSLLDDTGLADDTFLQEWLDFVYPDLEDHEGILERLRNN